MKKIVFLTIIALLIYIPLSAQQDNTKQAQKQGSTQSPQSAPQQEAKKTPEEERLAIIKADIQKELEQIKKLKKEIEELQKLFEQKVEQKDVEYLAQIAKIYESMQPEEAARRLERLDDDTAVTIIVTLKPKTAGRILAQIEEARAATLSKKILARTKVKQEKPTAN
ncbi:MAG: hypothetical protein N2738_09735 [Thermodesulfovibrionales bacterium]|nr:hypothetical protein [Thermodesulfovibrionales bacterium]